MHVQQRASRRRSENAMLTADWSTVMSGEQHYCHDSFFRNIAALPNPLI
jgi:hypothetical protein